MAYKKGPTYFEEKQSFFKSIGIDVYEIWEDEIRNNDFSCLSSNINFDITYKFPARYNTNPAIKEIFNEILQCYSYTDGAAGMESDDEEFEEKYPYKVGDRVTYRADKLLETQVITNMRWDSNYDCVLYYLDDCNIIIVEDILYRIGSPEDNITTIQDKTTVETMKEAKGNISDGYHTFNELYEYRLLYNASMFNELAKQGLYDVHKSKKHSDGTIPFGDEKTSERVKFNILKLK